MTSMPCPASPNSFQLRFRSRSRGSSSVLFNIRFRPSTRRVRLISASGGEGQSGTDNTPDSFAGWSGSESGDGGDPKKKNDKFGGLLGAGLAGIFFTAGVTFASLSLSSRVTSGGKQQMVPLTAEQELVLTSADQIAKVDQMSNDTDMIPDKQSKIDDCYINCQSGISEDLFPRIENNQDSTGSVPDNMDDSEPSVMENVKRNNVGVNSTPSVSSQDEIQIGQDTGGFLLPSSSKHGSSEISANGDLDLFTVASSTKDSPDTMFSGSPDQAVEYEANQSTANHVEPFPLSTDSTAHISEHQQGNLSHVDIPLNFSSEFESQFQTKSVTSNDLLLDSDGTVELQDTAKDVMDNEALVSQGDDIAHSDKLQFPTEASILNHAVDDIVKTVPYSEISGSYLDQNGAPMLRKESINSTEGCKLVENFPSAPYSALHVDAMGDESDISSPSQIARISDMESELPKKHISYAGIPAPSLISASLQMPPGKVLVPAVVDQVQGQAYSALQVLKIIEADVQPGDLCTRREYARWLVSASSALSRNTISKVYPAMYIENVTELAFDDVTPEDPDYPSIQGLAEAGIISSKLSESGLNGTSSEHQDSYFFFPGSAVSRQDLVSWKMALERRQLPEVDKNFLYQRSGYIDIDKIDKDAWPALVADLSAGDQGITALAFGYTRLFQPNKPVTKAQAAIALATGDAAEVVAEELTRIEAESLAEAAVNAHSVLVAQVEKELNDSFEAEIAKERENIGILEKLAEDTMLELEKLRAERAEEESALLSGRAAVESEMEVLSRLRHEVEEQLQDLLSNKMEIAFEKNRINKLRNEAESHNQAIVQLQYELEVERKALSMARAWAEEEAKRAREQARALEEARDRWKRHSIKVVVDEDLQEDASAGVTWLTAGKQPPADETVSRAESLVEKLKALAGQMKNRSAAAIERTIQKIVSLISALKEHAVKVSHSAAEYTSRSMKELKENASTFSSIVSERAQRTAEDCKGGVEKLTQKFKS